jgi:hypothetical protein
MTGSVTRVYPAASGQPGIRGAFDYSPGRQREKNTGPIPAGHYWVTPAQMWTNRWYNAASRSSWGNHRLTIHVMPGTQTHGRGGFFIHGGASLGSAGCINLNTGMDAFVRDVLDATQASRDCHIPLTVLYR